MPIQKFVHLWQNKNNLSQIQKLNFLPLQGSFESKNVFYCTHKCIVVIKNFFYPKYLTLKLTFDIIMPIKHGSLFPNKLPFIISP